MSKLYLAVALMASPCIACDAAPAKAGRSTPSPARAHAEAVSSRAPALAPRASASRSPAPAASVAPAPASAPPQQDDPLDPAGVLDDEERELIEADDATLSREQRVARAHAQRKLVMADPDHPLRPVLHQLEREVESGEYTRRSQDMFTGRAAFPDRDQDASGG